MRQWVSRRFQLLKLNTINNYRIETAYFGENWGNVLSTTIYTITYIIFLDAIFSKVGTIAGYNHDQMLVFTFIAQLKFYSLFTWSFDGVSTISEEVNNGNLDLVLVKPVPSLFYLTTRSVSVVRMVRDAAVPIAAILLAIHWDQAGIQMSTIPATAFVFICGQIIGHTLQFLLMIPVFWMGESRNLINTAYDLEMDVPWEGITGVSRILFGVLLPILIPAAMVTSVFLGKSDALSMMGWASAVAAVCLWLRSTLWKMALRSYTSASS